MKFRTTIALLLIATLGFGQETQKIPTLNNHVFVPIESVRSPFVNSSFSSSIGVFQSSTVPFEVVVIDDKPIQGELGGIVLASLGFSYQQKVKDWLSFQITPGLSTRVGTSFTGILSQGVSSVSGFNMNWLIRLSEKEKYMLSGSIQVANFTGTFISITSFVNDIIEQNPSPSLSSNIPVVNSGVGLRFAYGFNDLWGLTMAGNLNYGEGFSRAGAGFSYKIESAVDFNIANRTNVPLGFGAWYQLSTQPENTFNNTRALQAAGMKIAYMGTNDFTIGLNVNYVGLPIEFIENKIDVYGASITTKYYFN